MIEANWNGNGGFQAKRAVRHMDGLVGDPINRHDRARTARICGVWIPAVTCVAIIS